MCVRVLPLRGYAALLEVLDADLVDESPPFCPSSGRRMEQNGRIWKTLRTRLREVRVERTYFYCRACGGHFPLEHALDLEGKRVTLGAESLYAASSDSYEEASRKVRNLVGVEVPKTTLLRHMAGVGEEIQAFEREDAEASPPAERVLLGIDGTGVPMAAREVEGVAGKQADGTAKTSEAKVIACFTADSQDPKTGEPRKDKTGRSGSGTACSRPRNWWCCPTGRSGSATPARRHSQDRK